MFYFLWKFRNIYSRELSRQLFSAILLALVIRKLINYLYRVGRFDLLLILKKFVNIKASGNPMRIIQTMIIPKMAIAKLFSISAIKLYLHFYILYATIGEDWLTKIYSSDTVSGSCWRADISGEYVSITNPVLCPLFLTIVAATYIIRQAIVCMIQRHNCDIICSADTVFIARGSDMIITFVLY